MKLWIVLQLCGHISLPFVRTFSYKLLSYSKDEAVKFQLNVYLMQKMLPGRKFQEKTCKPNRDTDN